MSHIILVNAVWANLFKFPEDKTLIIIISGWSLKSSEMRRFTADWHPLNNYFHRIALLQIYTLLSFVQNGFASPHIRSYRNKFVLALLCNWPTFLLIEPFSLAIMHAFTCRDLILDLYLRISISAILGNIVAPAFHWILVSLVCLCIFITLYCEMFQFFVIIVESE